MDSITHIYCAASEKANNSALAYALLKYAFGELYGGVLPTVQKTSRNKPYFPDRPDVYFSISHSRTHVLCAIGDSPVGADTETVRSVNERVLVRVCLEEELHEFEFFELWTLKESYIKLTGDNRVSMRDIVFSKGRNGIFSPDPRVFSRLYFDVPNSVSAVCAYDNLLPEEILFVSTEKLQELS